ncbi:hypothetical protein GALMADRAFT_257439 [Galerina marginata CBS 339.88]|uniref:Steroid 5-alpha reductase C-terminal domain-containing protein n=1 Tax=Galerina marginata (strain CBS 339.88) TaxID=685588 RepID=A0A067SAN3_GALM3|nr:hypothetical protein GALMADRAFT_257439 [Galerina marginata CBS 339.88]
MSPVHALDRYYLALTLLVTVGYQLAGFAIAWTLQFDKITDFTGGSNFFFLALLTLLAGNTFHARNIVASVLVMVWAVRIGGFLLFRVLKMGSDSRFDEIRSHFWKFLAFWVAQMLWIWTVSLPLTILNSPGISDLNNGGSNPSFGTSRDIAGIVLWGLGFVIETVGDAQKYHYKANKVIPRGQPTNRGLWGWCRHPPYFGEIICWWGIWILCLSPTTNGHLSSSARAAQYGAIMSPIFTLLILMFGSGVPTAEKPTAKRFYLLSHGPEAREEDAHAWEGYKEYLRETSILIPLPPFLYRPLPRIVKKTVLLDFPVFHFDEATDGAAALQEAKRRQEEE